MWDYGAKSIYLILEKSSLLIKSPLFTDVDDMRVLSSCLNVTNYPISRSNYSQPWDPSDHKVTLVLTQWKLVSYFLLMINSHETAGFLVRKRRGGVFSLLRTFLYTLYKMSNFVQKKSISTKTILSDMFEFLHKNWTIFHS